VIAKPQACEGCPAYDQGIGFTLPDGPEAPRFIVLAGGADETDAQTSQPMCPSSPRGARFQGWLNQAGLSRGWALVTQVVCCWLPKGRTNDVPLGLRPPKKTEVAYCRAAHWGALLDRADHIVTLGDDAAKALLGREKVAKYRGSFERVEL
jgi:uracil-DNA glycosylase